MTSFYHTGVLQHPLSHSFLTGWTKAVNSFEDKHFTRSSNMGTRAAACKASQSFISHIENGISSSEFYLIKSIPYNTLKSCSLPESLI